MTQKSIPQRSLNSLKENVEEESSALSLDVKLNFDPTTLPTLGQQGITWLFNFFPRQIHTLQFVNTVTRRFPVFTYKPEDLKEAVQTALKYNFNGYEIYFMVNPGNGEISPGKRTARSSGSVTGLSHLFIDTDNCPIDKVRSYLNSINLTPHAEIESSPNRFHLYFKLLDDEFSEKQIVTWKKCQHVLHRLGDLELSNPKLIGMDNTMHDYSKVLRIPGFLHVSKQSVVRLVEERTHSPYSLEYVADLLRVEEFDLDSASTVLSLEDDTIVQKGERFQALQSYALHLANRLDLTQAERKDEFRTFIVGKIDNDDHEFLSPDKLLTAKSRDLLSSAMKKVDREITITVHEATESIDKPVTSPWSLPDSFYTSAPNGFGDVVKEVLSACRFPRPAIAFGTFLSGLSILKARSYRTHGGSSPALYILITAPSGYGKGHPYVILQNTFHALGLRSLIINELRSDRGFANHLESTEGRALFLSDEIYRFLKTIQNPEAASFHANIMREFLRTFSAGSIKGFSYGKVGETGKKKGEKEIVIDCPSLAICGYLVTEDFETLFTRESITRGLLQRFIPIVTEPSPVVKNLDANASLVITHELFTSLKIDADELDAEGNPVPSIEAKSFIRMPFTGEAYKVFNALEDYYIGEMEKAARHRETLPLSGLYSRVGEQIERVATVLARDAIDVETLDYARRFVESRHQALMATAENTFMERSERMRSQTETESYLMHAFKRCSKGTGIISIRELYQRCRKSFRNYSEFKQGVETLTQSGVLDEITMPGKKKLVKGLRLGDVLTT